jgi:ribosome biogenesis GTPase A
MIPTKLNGLDHIAFADVINSDLKLVKVSPFARSETRFIRPIKIDKKQLGDLFSEEVILVDSPGLFETKRAEVDVSNQLGIIKGISKAESVQPVILFSYLKLGSRCENIKEVIDFYSKIVSDTDYVHNFNFFFSHVPDEITYKNISAFIKDSLDKLSDKD